MSFVIGIDIGTYESKGVLVNQAGNLITSATIPHRLEIPRRGWAEHDAEQTWWHDFVFLCQKIISEANDKHGIVASDIAAVGVSSIGPAIVPVDIEGNPLRKAILYGIDTRAEREYQILNKAFDRKRIFESSGQHISSQSTGPKILWIRNQEPEIYEKTYKFLCGAGYIVYKLTNEYIIDRFTAASYTPLFNLQREDWDYEVLHWITEEDKLPRLAWSHEIVGTITMKAADETGLALGTKVIAGTIDALSESISVGAVHLGDLMLMYGSSTFYILITKSLAMTETLWPSIHAVSNIKTLTGGTATAGSLTRWFIDQWMGELMEGNTLTIDQAYTHLTNLAQNSPPGANGLITLPYFSGERTPIHNGNAKGIFFGLSLHHTKPDIFRSILEGIAFSIRHNLEEMQKHCLDIKRVIAVGGGVKSRLWLQSVSDICQVKQIIPEITIGASYGNAFLCALALGWYNHITDIDQWIQGKYEIEPQTNSNELYQQYYQIYRQLYLQTKELMNEL